MRIDKRKGMCTLDQDIFQLWREHGWDVQKIIVPVKAKKHTWIIEAQPSKIQRLIK